MAPFGSPLYLVLTLVFSFPKKRKGMVAFQFLTVVIKQGLKCSNKSAPAPSLVLASLSGTLAYAYYRIRWRTDYVSPALKLLMH